VLPAPITPFGEDGSIRTDLFEQQIDYLAKAGVHGFFVAGTTAEGAMLSDDERRTLFRIMVDRTTEQHLRCVVLVKPDTRAVLTAIDRIVNEAPDYISAVTPFYVSVTQAEIIGHYTAIADHSPVPVLLYNIPQNTGNPMTLPTILELSQHPNIVGIKDSTGNMPQFQRGLLAGQSDDFTWIQGEDLVDAVSFLTGVRCIVSGLSNAWAEPYVAMWKAVEAGNHAAVIAEQRRINALAEIIFRTDGKVVPAIKTAAALQGRSTRHTRVPSMQLSSAHEAAVAEVIGELGLI
jgi:4-hydroxy-tetrahydrodipicolinate synthase